MPSSLAHISLPWCIDGASVLLQGSDTADFPNLSCSSVKWRYYCHSCAGLNRTLCLEALEYQDNRVIFVDIQNIRVCFLSVKFSVKVLFKIRWVEISFCKPPLIPMFFRFWRSLKNSWIKELIVTGSITITKYCLTFNSYWAIQLEKAKCHVRYQ